MPTRSGFGSKLIRSSVEYDLGGHVQIEYPTTGLVGRFRIPARYVMQPFMTRSAVPATTHTRTDILRGLNILLVEDQAIIAMDTEQALMALGATSVKAFSSVTGATAGLDASTTDAAVLDFNLEGETVTNFADELVQRNIPFVFATGYGDSVMIPERFSRIPIVRKPVSLLDLGEKLSLAFLGRSIGNETPRPH